MSPQDGTRSGRKEAFPPSGEVQIHPSVTIVQDWASSIVSGSGIEESRTRMIEAFRDLPEAIREQEFIRAYYRTIHFVDRHNLKAARPALVAAVQELPEDPKPEHLELIGFTAIVLEGAQDSDGSKKLGASVNVAEFAARLGHAVDFNGEDWLTSLAMITWHKGIQKEMQAKIQAREENLHYLLDLNPDSITLDHITTMHNRVIHAIYPNSHNTETFRPGETVYDSASLYIADLMLRMRALTFDAAGRRKTLGRYLDEFNSAVVNSTSPAGYPLAELYTGYLVIHPHQDGNGSMIKTLIDYYTTKRGLPRINWDLTKTDNAAGAELTESFDTYIYKGERIPLVDWFQRRIAAR